MKLSYPQLESHLTKTIAPLYIVSGDETLLVQEALDAIRQAAFKLGFTERTHISLESSADWDDLLYSTTQNLSLFATQRLLELDLTHVKLNATHSKTLQEMAQRLSSDILLLIRIHKLDSKGEQSAWFRALEKKGVTLSIWPIPIEQLPQWIIQRAKKRNLTLTRSIADYLATQVEGNLLAASQEIEKLSLLYVGKEIDLQTIQEEVTDNAHFDIFALVDSALIGNPKRSLRILDNLFAEKIEPTLILWAITREIRTLAEIARLTQRGEMLSDLFSKFRIWEKRQAAVRQFLKRHSIKNCWDFMLKAAEIDRMIKGAEEGNVWDGLGELMLNIASSNTQS